MENSVISSVDKQGVDSVSENIQTDIHTEESNPKSSVESWKPDEDQSSSEEGKSVGGEINENAVIDAISTVYDPEIPVNVYDLGLIYAVDLHDDGRVHVEMTLTAPNCPSAQELPIMIQQAIEKVDGVVEVKVDVVWDPPWDVSRMSDEARLTLNMF
ncbi:SUF system Fe-S cluster assembly protein [Commensalibacter communis]|uniref:SUF system Fe-S cluster assembly protein n=1 Tax=Commensalibacter communis TaxID=2972786 RepID=UPI0022FFBD73|nr:SUF system Fe-S cluster assembly protein [Commensalibacter communis]CAI3922329.1 Metal-sulfur cluster biosynthetic enzyme (PaaD) (PDB:1UWD) [Commensalibacter communis]CAI3932710.1 Metal-sulfur cluster biosynthetic enzyme (PaaD) (PDB:1UWD) [Commensalibacter communis]